MSGEINVVSRTQHIIVDPASSAIAIINAGPPGPGGPGGEVGSGITLPPPLAAGTPFRTYVDELGDRWVANGDIYTGAWKRAQDVLHAAYSRTATYRIPITPEKLAYNAIIHDIYRMYDFTLGRFTALVPGLYRYCSTISGLAYANNYIRPDIRVNNVVAVQRANSPSHGGAFGVTVELTRHLNAGDYMETFMACGVTAGVAGSVSTGETALSIDYLGTG